MTDTPTPKNAKPVINNSEALANSPARIVHINHGGPFRAVTVAYEQINRSHLKIATAVTHKADTFTRKVGTQIALRNFDEGKTVVVPLAKNTSAVDQLRGMFGFIA